MTGRKMTITAGEWCECEAVPVTPKQDKFVVGSDPVTLTADHIGKRPTYAFSYKIKEALK